MLLRVPDGEEGAQRAATQPAPEADGSFAGLRPLAALCDLAVDSPSSSPQEQASPELPICGSPNSKRWPMVMGFIRTGRVKKLHQTTQFCALAAAVSGAGAVLRLAELSVASRTPPSQPRTRSIPEPSASPEAEEDAEAPRKPWKLLRSAVKRASQVKKESEVMCVDGDRLQAMTWMLCAEKAKAERGQSRLAHYQSKVRVVTEELMHEKKNVNELMQELKNMQSALHDAAELTKQLRAELHTTGETKLAEMRQRLTKQAMEIAVEKTKSAALKARLKQLGQEIQDSRTPQDEHPPLLSNRADTAPVDKASAKKEARKKRGAEPAAEPRPPPPRDAPAGRMVGGFLRTDDGAVWRDAAKQADDLRRRAEEEQARLRDRTGQLEAQAVRLRKEVGDAAEAEARLRRELADAARAQDEQRQQQQKLQSDVRRLRDLLAEAEARPPPAAVMPSTQPQTAGSPSKPGGRAEKSRGRKTRDAATQTLRDGGAPAPAPPCERQMAALTRRADAALLSGVEQERVRRAAAADTELAGEDSQLAHAMDALSYAMRCVDSMGSGAHLDVVARMSALVREASRKWEKRRAQILDERTAAIRPLLVLLPDGGEGGRAGSGRRRRKETAPSMRVDGTPTECGMPSPFPPPHPPPRSPVVSPPHTRHGSVCSRGISALRVDSQRAAVGDMLRIGSLPKVERSAASRGASPHPSAPGAQSPQPPALAPSGGGSRRGHPRPPLASSAASSPASQSSGLPAPVSPASRGRASPPAPASPALSVSQHGALEWNVSVVGSLGGMSPPISPPISPGALKLSRGVLFSTASSRGTSPAAPYPLDSGMSTPPASNSTTPAARSGGTSPAARSPLGTSPAEASPAFPGPAGRFLVHAGSASSSPTAAPPAQLTGRHGVTAAYGSGGKAWGTPPAERPAVQLALAPPAAEQAKMRPRCTPKSGIITPERAGPCAFPEPQPPPLNSPPRRQPPAATRLRSG